MSSSKDKENGKQKVAGNWYQTLISNSKKTNENAQLNFISINCKKLNEIFT